MVTYTKGGTEHKIYVFRMYINLKIDFKSAIFVSNLTVSNKKKTALEIFASVFASLCKEIARRLLNFHFENPQKIRLTRK